MEFNPELDRARQRVVGALTLAIIAILVAIAVIAFVAWRDAQSRRQVQGLAAQVAVATVRADSLGMRVDSMQALLEAERTRGDSLRTEIGRTSEQVRRVRASQQTLAERQSGAEEEIERLAAAQDELPGEIREETRGLLSPLSLAVTERDSLHSRQIAALTDKTAALEHWQGVHEMKREPALTKVWRGLVTVAAAIGIATGLGD